MPVSKNLSSLYFRFQLFYHLQLFCIFVVLKELSEGFMRKCLVLACLIVISCLSGWAQSAKYGNAFLSLGVGARGLAMANTMTAISDDVTSPYWNPAGLVRSEHKYQLALMHAEYFAGIAKYDYASLAYKINDYSAVGVSFIRFGVDNILNTTELIDNQGNLDYNRISYFSVADMALLLTYSHQFKQVKGLSLGGNVKIIRRRIGDFAGAWGFGLDMGVQYNFKGWQFGVMLRDATSTFDAWSFSLSDQMIEVFQNTGNEIPENGLELTLPVLSLGAAKYVELGKGFNATFALDFDWSFDGQRNTLIRSNVLSIDPHFGMEFAYKKIVAIRAGIGNLQQEIDFEGKKKTTVQINAGLGVCIKNIVAIDYTFTDLGNISGALYSHIFSLKVGLDSFKRQKRDTEL